MASIFASMKLILALSILFRSSVKADICSSSTLINATGSLTASAAKFDDSHPAFQWKLSNLIAESPNPDAPHVSRVRHIFEVETSPYQNFTDPTYPVTGCVFFISTFSRAYANGIYDDGTCSSVLDTACLSELITTVNSTAVQISKTVNATQEASCVSLQQKMKSIDQMDSNSKCSSHWALVDYTFLSTPGAAYLPSSDPTCATTDVNTGNTTSIFKNGWTTFSSKEGDYLAYDAALSVPLPVIVVTWPKIGDSGKVDTKIVCVPGNQTISNGSRNVGVASVAPTAVNGTSANSTSTSTSTSTSATSSGVSSFSAKSYIALIAALAFGLMM